MEYDDTSSGLEGYTSKNEESTPEAPKERLKSACNLRSLHHHLVDMDETSERNRSKVQNLKDYKPPLDEQVLRKRGQGSRFNINFGEVASVINEATSQYIDSFVSPEHLIEVKLARNTFEDSQRYAYQRIMSDEFTKMIRSWDGGLYEYLTLIDQFVTHGVGIGYFEDSTTWQWRGAGLRDIKFPRRTQATPDGVEVCTCESFFTPSELSEKIQDEEAATAMGWDVEVVKMALKNSSDELYQHDYPEEMQEAEKANDLENQYETTVFNPIRVIHAWVKEMDGSVSSYICTKNAPGSNGKRNKDLEKRYLFKSQGEYENLSEALHIFPFQTGNKGNIYTVRGLGYMMYPQGMAYNLMQCHLLDSAKDSLSVKYISPSEKAIDRVPIIQAGPATLIPPQLQIAENQKAPDLQRSAMPALDLLTSQMNKRSVSSTMSSVFSDAPDRRSKFELTAALEHFNSLNSAAMLLFSRPWRSLLTECVKRAFDPIQNALTESGEMALRMQKACMERGVPPQALFTIDLHETKTGVPAGPGGKAARAAQFEAAAAMYTSMDDAGRQAFNRDKLVDILGVERADRYISLEQPRELLDHQIARLENNDLIEGSKLSPSNSENYLVHLRVHLEALMAGVQQVEEGEAELTEVTERLYGLFIHASETYDIAVVPEVVLPEMQEIKQTLQQVGEYLNNGLRQIQKMERDIAEQGVDDPQEQGPSKEQLEAERKIQDMQMKAEAHMQKMQQSAESHQQKLALEAQKAMQDLAINDAKGAQSLRS
ncbi:MAG: hypothetical protein ACPH5P_00020 [Akkermansiaceae bacterium]